MSREIRSFVYGREYLPTGLAGSSTCRLLSVTDDQIEVLRNLVNYAHQRRSWNDETIDADRYYLPSDEDWDILEALVADLEDKLMSDLDPVDGDLIIGNVTPEWSKLAVSIPGADLVNVLAVANSELRPSWKTASSNPGAAVAVLASDVTGGLQLDMLGIGVAPSAFAGIDTRKTFSTKAASEWRCGVYSRMHATVDHASYSVFGFYGESRLKGGSAGVYELTGMCGLAYHEHSTLAGYVVGGRMIAECTSSGVSSNLHGVHARATASGTNTSKPVGVNIISQRSSTSSADAFGIRLYINSLSTGKILSGYGISIEPPAKAAGATFTNSYGLYIGNHNVAGTLNYAIYTNEGDVRLGGKFGCNAATPQASAAVNADSTDLPTVIALCNQLRATLVANGICV